MAGFLLEANGAARCAHGGVASALAPNPRVRLSGSAAVSLPASYVVSGCPDPPPPAGTGPCVTGQFLTGATRLLSEGRPLALAGATGVCSPTGAILIGDVTQTRVSAL